MTPRSTPSIPVGPTPIQRLESVLKHNATNDGEVVSLMNMLGDALHEARHQACACGEAHPTPVEPEARCDRVVNNGFGEPTECGRTMPCEYHDTTACGEWFGGQYAHDYCGLPKGHDGKHRSPIGEARPTPVEPEAHDCPRCGEPITDRCWRHD